MFLGNEASLCSELLGPGALDPGAVILPYYAQSFRRYAAHQLCNIQVNVPTKILKLEELDRYLGVAILSYYAQSFDVTRYTISVIFKLASLLKVYLNWKNWIHKSNLNRKEMIFVSFVFELLPTQ